jgi:hypothetical protein
MPQAVLWARPGKPLIPVAMGIVNVKSAGVYPNHRMTHFFAVNRRSFETWNLNKSSNRIQVKKTPAKKNQERRKKKKDHLEKI